MQGRQITTMAERNTIKANLITVSESRNKNSANQEMEQDSVWSPNQGLLLIKSYCFRVVKKQQNKDMLWSTVIISSQFTKA